MCLSSSTCVLLYLARELQKRLQIASAGGVPVTISEFSLRVINVTNRAAIAEKLFYAIFSEPKVRKSSLSAATCCYGPTDTLLQQLPAIS